MRVKQDRYNPDRRKELNIEAIGGLLSGSIGQAIVGGVVSSVVSSLFGGGGERQSQQGFQYSPLPTPVPAAQPAVNQPVAPISSAEDLAAAKTNKMLKQIQGYTSSNETKNMSRRNTQATTLLGGGTKMNALT